ncbi:MAG: hypothetical protein ACJAV1_003098 [Paraglaciecola sp.]|jgi:hypothetical protein
MISHLNLPRLVMLNPYCFWGCDVNLQNQNQNQNQNKNQNKNQNQGISGA